MERNICDVDGEEACFAQAQQSAQPNPLDTVPEKLPFDVPYGTPISLERAETAIAAAITEAKT